MKLNGICVLALGAGLASLGACASTPAAHPPETFGDAVRANIALHTVNPDGPDDPVLTFVGERQAVVIARYAADGVESPGAVDTQAGAGQ